MSNYTSENTEILAMHTEERYISNTRMLLHHVFESGRTEFVIGSYFTSVWNGKCYEYTWDWGHYFGSFEQAAMYWLQDVHGLHIHDEEGAAL